MDFYARSLELSPTLGIEEGEARITCPPGTVKSYLPEWPWSECIPEAEALEPGPPVEVETPVPLPAPPPVQPLPPPPPPTPSIPGKARFLKVDPTSGAILDPDTGAMIEAPGAFSAETVDTVASVSAGLGILAIILVAVGVFK